MLQTLQANLTWKVSSISRLKVLVLVLLMFSLTGAQNCDNTGVSASVSDVSSVPATLSGEATQNAFTLDLTTPNSASFGGLFFDEATAFTGPGGFSAKFSIVNTGANSGGAWEFIIAGEGNMEFAIPPYGEGESSYQVAGWSRLNALVIEFDCYNSGESERDITADHVSVFLAGAKQENCEYDLPDGTKLSDGTQYTVWVDFSGFNTQLDVRIGTDAFTRPDAAAVSCPVSIWDTLDINSKFHVGIGGYNDNLPTVGNDDATTLSLAEAIFVADARRPADTETCAFYNSCSSKTVAGLCTLINSAGNACRLEECGNTLQWDMSSSTCCSFVERGSYRADESNGSSSAGDEVACSFKRNTILEVADSSLCDFAAQSPLPSPAASETPSATPSATPSSPPLSFSAASESASPSVSVSPSSVPSASPSASPSPSIMPSPSATPSMMCADLCPREVDALDCSLSTIDEDVAKAQGIPCFDNDSGASRTCACSGFDASALVGGIAADTSDNTNFSNCVAGNVQAVGSIRTGTFSNVFIKSLNADESDGIFLENDIVSSKICTVEGRSGKVVFGSIAVSDVFINQINAAALDKQSTSSYDNVDINGINISFGLGLRYTVDNAGNGGTISYNDVQFDDMVVLGPCTADEGVTVDVDSSSSQSGTNFFLTRGSGSCPAMFNA